MAAPPEVRQVEPGETALAYEALRELRPEIGSADELVVRIDTLQRPEGYRLVGTFVPSREAAAAVAGFRRGHSLAWGDFLYVDDLVARPEFRRQGHGAALLGWVEAEARRLGCDAVHLDSGRRREGAHRFYRAVGYEDFGLHFGRFVET